MSYVVSAADVPSRDVFADREVLSFVVVIFFDSDFEISGISFTSTIPVFVMFLPGKVTYAIVSNLRMI